jgi:hypothetical protein
MKRKRTAKKHAKVPKRFSSLKLEASNEGNYAASYDQLENTDLSDLPYGTKVCLLARDAPGLRSATNAFSLAFEAIGEGLIRVHTYYLCCRENWGGQFLDYNTFVNIAWTLLQKRLDVIKNLDPERVVEGFHLGDDEVADTNFHTALAVDVRAGTLKEMQQVAWKLLDGVLKPLYDYNDEIVRTVWKRFHLKYEEFPL